MFCRRCLRLSFSLPAKRGWRAAAGIFISCCTGVILFSEAGLVRVAGSRSVVKDAYDAEHVVWEFTEGNWRRAVAARGPTVFFTHDYASEGSSSDVRSRGDDVAYSGRSCRPLVSSVVGSTSRGSGLGSSSAPSHFSYSSSSDDDDEDQDGPCQQLSGGLLWSSPTPGRGDEGRALVAKTIHDDVDEKRGSPSPPWIEEPSSTSSSRAQRPIISVDLNPIPRGGEGYDPSTTEVEQSTLTNSLAARDAAPLDNDTVVEVVIEDTRERRTAAPSGLKMSSNKKVLTGQKSQEPLGTTTRRARKYPHLLIKLKDLVNMDAFQLYQRHLLWRKVVAGEDLPKNFEADPWNWHLQAEVDAVNKRRPGGKRESGKTSTRRKVVKRGRAEVKVVKRKLLKTSTRRKFSPAKEKIIGTSPEQDPELQPPVVIKIQPHEKLSTVLLEDVALHDLQVRDGGRTIEEQRIEERLKPASSSHLSRTIGQYVDVVHAQLALERLKHDPTPDEKHNKQAAQMWERLRPLLRAQQMRNFYKNYSEDLDVVFNTTYSSVRARDFYLRLNFALVSNTTKQAGEQGKEPAVKKVIKYEKVQDFTKALQEFENYFYQEFFQPPAEKDTITMGSSTSSSVQGQGEDSQHLFHVRAMTTSRSSAISSSCTISSLFRGARPTSCSEEEEKKRSYWARWIETLRTGRDPELYNMNISDVSRRWLSKIFSPGEDENKFPAPPSGPGELERILLDKAKYVPPEYATVAYYKRSPLTDQSKPLPRTDPERAEKLRKNLQELMKKFDFTGMVTERLLHAEVIKEAESRSSGRKSVGKEVPIYAPQAKVSVLDLGSAAARYLRRHGEDIPPWAVSSKFSLLSFDLDDARCKTAEEKKEEFEKKKKEEIEAREAREARRPADGKMLQRCLNPGSGRSGRSACSSTEAGEKSFDLQSLRNGKMYGLDKELVAGENLYFNVVSRVVLRKFLKSVDLQDPDHTRTFYGAAALEENKTPGRGANPPRRIVMTNGDRLSSLTDDTLVLQFIWKTRYVKPSEALREQSDELQQEAVDEGVTFFDASPFRTKAPRATLERVSFHVRLFYNTVSNTFSQVRIHAYPTDQYGNTYKWGNRTEKEEARWDGTNEGVGLLLK
ncbi:unnamed protein product [Amoebophrya sp. A120]|nr:unnamed protein product [Amoebophrya sp. A120]|eukprot:GSA120T00025056001.1